MKKFSVSRTKVKENLKLVDFVIRKYYAWTGLTETKQQCRNLLYLTYNDLRSEGVIGLIKAAKKWKTFKKKKTMSFTTFAVWYIRSAIRLSVFKTGMSIVKIPRHVFRRKRKIDNKLTKNNGTYVDLFNEGSISLKSFEDLNSIDNSMKPMSIEECVINGEDVDHNAYSNIVRPIFNRDLKAYARKVLWSVIKKTYEHHRKRNYTIIMLKLGLLPHHNPISFKSVEKFLNKKQRKELSQSSLRKIYSVVMPKFRKELKDRLNKEGSSYEE